MPRSPSLQDFATPAENPISMGKTGDDLSAHLAISIARVRRGYQQVYLSDSRQIRGQSSQSRICALSPTVRAYGEMHFHFQGHDS